jgi:hypothetical protein
VIKATPDPIAILIEIKSAKSVENKRVKDYSYKKSNIYNFSSYKFTIKSIGQICNQKSYWITKSSIRKDFT